MRQDATPAARCTGSIQFLLDRDGTIYRRLVRYLAEKYPTIEYLTARGKLSG